MISVVIPTYKRAESLQDTLSGLKTQHLNGEAVSFEVLVVDNNSKDKTKEVVEKMAEDFGRPLRYLFESVQGAAHARNCGIRQANGEIIAFLDDDVIPDSDWLSALWDCFEEEDVDLVGGKIDLLWLSEKPEWLSRKLMKPLIQSQNGEKRFRFHLGEAYLFGANFACRKTLFEKIGLFREELGRRGNSLIGGEDFEWFERAEKAGATLFYEPRAKVQHKVFGEKLTEDYIRRWFLDIGRTHGHLMEWKWHHGITVVPLWCLGKACVAAGRHRYFTRGEDKSRRLEEETEKLFYQGILEERTFHWKARMLRRPLSCHFV